jgi:hypothetical protein
VGDLIVFNFIPKSDLAKNSFYELCISYIEPFKSRELKQQQVRLDRVELDHRGEFDNLCKVVKESKEWLAKLWVFPDCPPARFLGLGPLVIKEVHGRISRDAGAVTI